MATNPLGAKESPDDPRLKILGRLRVFALFWIAVLVINFVAAGFELEKLHTSMSQAGPAFALLAGCIAIGAVWNAAAIMALSHAGLLDEKRAGPWRRG